MRKSLRNPEGQDDHKKGTLSNQPRLTCVTPTALLGSWVLQPIKHVMPLRTDFKTHAKWQGYVEESAAKGFVARKVRTIALSKVQGTHWNAIKCQKHLGNCPEAVFRQATINLDSQVWKSLGDSLPKLYGIDLVEAYVTQKSVSSRILSAKKGIICDCPTDVYMRNLWQKAERGKKTGTNSYTRYPQASCFKKMRHVCQKNGGAHTTWYFGVPKGMRKQDEKSDSCAAKKGAKKLVSSNCAEILGKK
jgi:hypothetical protein